MGIYDVKYKKLALMLLPTSWRKPLMSALLYAMLAPVAELHARLRSYQKEKDYRLSHNGQVCYLTAVLNDALDASERRITIADTERDNPVMWLRERVKSYPLTVYPRKEKRAVMISRRGMTGNDVVDFVVKVPTSVSTAAGYDNKRLCSLVNMYKPAGMRYIVLDGTGETTKEEAV